MNRETIVEKLRETAKNNRISCEQAHELAKILGVPLGEIGACCNELHIKISACQLGCF